MAAIASIIVPAHDEQGRIGATLRSVTADARRGEFDVVVVCNGCADATATEASDVPGVRVVEIPQASKSAALRAGDHSTAVFPRIYLDADVLLDTDTARELAAALTVTGAPIAGVPGRYDLSTSSALVQLFFEFRQRLPVFRDGIIGAGVYALSRSGRQHFGDWPDLLADDQFVYRLFAAHERVTLRDRHTIVEAPADVPSLVRRGIRVRRGNDELGRGVDDQPELPPPPAGLDRALLSSLRTPRGWLSAVVFGVITMLIRILTRLGHVDDWRPSEPATTRARTDAHAGVGGTRGLDGRPEPSAPEVRG